MVAFGHSMKPYNCSVVLVILAATISSVGCRALRQNDVYHQPLTSESWSAPVDTVGQSGSGMASPAQQQTRSSQSFPTQASAIALKPPPEGSVPEGSGEQQFDFGLSDGTQIEQAAYLNLPSTSQAEIVVKDASITMDEFQSLALANNPTIAELVATTQKAAGFRTQVGLRANPSFGYNGTQIADQDTDQHTLFLSQSIITGSKLELNRRVLNEALRSQLMELEAQKFRVLTDVRVQFYEALAAQRRLDLIKDFLAVSEKGLEFAELRKQALEGSQLDVVQAKVLLYEIDLSLRQAQARFIAAWKKLAALAGVPDMEPIYLEGSLPQEEGGTLDWDAIRSSVLTASPEYQAALARVSQARANLNRQNVQPIPNVDFQIGSGYDRGTDNGLINLQVGAPIPIFNQNQGNICAARADYARATREVQRIADAIQARLASTSGELEASLAAVQKFSSDIIPNAEEGLRLAELAYQAGETSYVQVLIAQRMYFDANLQFIQAQAELGQARAQIDGYLLTGALDPVVDNSGDDSLRGLTFGQQ